jgi:hypothetical protein
MLILAGCGAASSKQDPAEQSIVAQAAEVRAEKTDQIQIEKTPLGDDDLKALAGLENLHILLLDSPDSQFSAEGLKQLAGLLAIEHLRIRGRGVDDPALTQFSELKSLRILNVPHGTFTDAGLDSLKGLPDLVHLRFGSPHVTDAGMKTIGELTALKRLHLIDVPITDAGLRDLAQMRQLESLYVDGGRFSDGAIEELFRLRPDLHVHLNQQHHDRDPQKYEHP